MMSKYIFVKQGLGNKGEFVERDEWNEEFTDDKDWYASTYYYEQNALDYYKTKQSLKGFRDVKTDKLWFDFDDDNNLDNARKDAKEVITRLKSAGINESSIDVYFSGGKGFEVSVRTNKMLNRTQVEHLAVNVFGKDLTTFDTSLYDENQILRLPNTRHQKTGLYKVQLSIAQLNLPIEAIKKHAETSRPIKLKETSDLKEELLVIPEAPKKEVNTEALNFSMANKPHHWKDYKWALLNAHMVKPDERTNSLMVIAATCKGLGYDESLTRAMCLSFDEKFTKYTGKPPVDDLDRTLDSVFADDWNGGQYSHKNNVWLQNYCKRINITVNTATDELTVEIDDVFSLFKDYAKNIDKLTVKSGIPSLDKKVRMTIGMLVGIVAAPGVGKTSLAIQMLNTMSKRNEQCVFFSYDMYHSLVIQKLIQKHFKQQPEYIFEQFKNGNPEYEEKVRNVLKEEYKNVEFCFNSGQTPEDIEMTIKHTREKTNKDIRLVVIDYNELVMSNFSDPTQSSAFVIQKMREIANKYNCCVIVLLQPNKLAGSPSDELKSYRSAKGSSAIEQAMSVMLGISRPGYNPRKPEEDKFLVINGLKNRMGSLFNVELSWDGLTGSVREMNEEERRLLKEIEERKNAEKEGKSDDW